MPFLVSQGYPQIAFGRNCPFHGKLGNWHDIVEQLLDFNKDLEGSGRKREQRPLLQHLKRANINNTNNTNNVNSYKFRALFLNKFYLYMFIKLNRKYKQV